MTGVIYTKDSQRRPADQEKLGERPGTDSPSWPSKGKNPACWFNVCSMLV